MSFGVAWVIQHSARLTTFDTVEKHYALFVRVLWERPRRTIESGEGQAQLELAFTTFQKALQGAIDSKNGVLEADILISLASEAQPGCDRPECSTD